MSATHKAGNAPVEAAAWPSDAIGTTTRNRDTAMNTATEDSTMNRTQQDHTEHATSNPKPPSLLRRIAARTNDLAFGASIALELVQESREAEQDGHPPTLNRLREEALLRLASAVLNGIADQAVGDLLGLDCGED